VVQLVILYRTDYLLHVRMATREGDPPPEIILRAMLKRMWRDYGVQCRSVTPPNGPADASSPSASPQGPTA
jgi:hypothetical protein